MGAPDRIFSRSGQWKGLKDESLQRAPGAEARLRWRHFLKIMHTLSTETWDNICSTKSTLQHLQGWGQVPPYPSCGHPWLSKLLQIVTDVYTACTYYQFTSGLLSTEIRQRNTNLLINKRLLLCILQTHTQLTLLLTSQIKSCVGGAQIDPDTPVWEICTSHHSVLLRGK